VVRCDKLGRPDGGAERVGIAEAKNALSSDFKKAGYSIAHAAEASGTPMRLVEVYPHPALLFLLNRKYRVPYKVDKSGRYWPDLDIGRRIFALLTEFEIINQALTRIMGPTGIIIPNSASVRTLRSLKCYEGAIDALISAVGRHYLF